MSTTALCFLAWMGLLLILLVFELFLALWDVDKNCDGCMIACVNSALVIFLVSYIYWNAVQGYLG